MALHPPAFDRVYVVSDIHMGGSGADFQMFNRGERLAAFVRGIAREKPEGEAALILNGDIVDTLAERSPGDYMALDATNAVAVMERISRDPSFQPVWDALGEFVRVPNRHLVIVVGNHDIELALPVVESWLLERLAPGDEAAGLRIHLSTHGAGFGCEVGGARVFCTHGNEADEWNVVDFNELGQLANAMNAGRVVARSAWRPNAGTRLVVDVMNIVKSRYPFVDLLKPETAAVASILLALDKETFRRVNLADALPVLRDKVRGALVARRLLGAADSDLSLAPPHAVAEETARQLLGPSLREALGHTPSRSADEILLAAGMAVATGRRASQLDAPVAQPETLGARDVFAGWLRLLPPEEALRRALADWLRSDRTFEISETDDVCNRMKEHVSSDVPFVVAGHTHLSRAVALGEHRYYFNSGTWARLLRLADAALGESAFAEKVWPALKSGHMAALDEAKVPTEQGDQPLVFDRTNAVRIAAEGAVVRGSLLRVTGGGTQGEVGWALEPGTDSFEVPVP